MGNGGNGQGPVAAPIPGGGGDGQLGSGRGYYKVGTPSPIGRSPDVYNAGGSTTGKGAEGAPAYSGASNADLKKLGKAPNLDDSQDASAAGGGPEAPAPVMVNQSTSQDLSLPDDEFTSRYFKDDKSKRYLKNAAQKGKNFGKGMLRSTGVPIGF